MPPTIVLIPGAWHLPAIYDKMIGILESRGYSCSPFPLPSVGALAVDDALRMGAELTTKNFKDDVREITDHITALVEQDERDVIVVSHSYSGMPVGEALEGLSKQERHAKGLKGGVTRLVFIMSFAVPPGFQPTAGGKKYPDWMNVDTEVTTPANTLL